MLHSQQRLLPDHNGEKNLLKHIIMLLRKNNMAPARRLIGKFQILDLFKTCLLIILIVLGIFSTDPVFAQKKHAAKITKVAAENTYKQMLDYSRPGKYHQLLGDLTGKWIFKGRQFRSVDSLTSTVDFEVSGTLVRKSFANGRYFVVNILSDSTSKLEMPIQDGKMLLTKFRGVDIEGYDNVKKKFVTASIGNDLYSLITVSEGSYDPTTKTIAYYSKYEPVPGLTRKDELLFTFIDKDHYKMQMFQMENGKYRKGMELDVRRTN
jgi:hypothetical protein